MFDGPVSTFEIISFINQFPTAGTPAFSRSSRVHVQLSSIRMRMLMFQLYNSLAQCVLCSLLGRLVMVIKSVRPVVYM